MKKLYLYISFILSLFFFNEAKAQTLTGDVVVCTTTTGNIVNHSQFIAVPGGTTAGTRNSSIYRQCDTTGSSVRTTLTLHKIGLCTSAPTVKFVDATARTNDQRRTLGVPDGDVGDSIFTSCQFVVDSTAGYLIAMSSAGEVFPVGTDDIVNPGTYTHGVFVIDKSVTVTAEVNFSGTITSRNSGRSANTGQSTRCITNGSTIIDTGAEGPIVNNVVYGGDGALCHSSTAATANTISYLYSNVDGVGNTTRGVESTSLGSINFYNVNNNLQRVRILTADNGTGTATTKLLLVVTFTNPLVVTENYEYLDVLQNLSRTVSLDFEQGNDLASTTIRLIQQGPFGIAFRTVEGAGKF